MQDYQRQVNYYETDKMGITHHSNYLRWMEEARLDLLEQLGWGYARLEEMGIVSPVLSAELQYKHPTTYPDLLTIHTEVESLTSVKLTLQYHIYRKDGSEVCQGRTSHTFLDRSGKILRLKKVVPEFYALLLDQVKNTKGNE